MRKSQNNKGQPFDPASKKFNRCTLNVRDFPLERFRLPRDGRKWKQAARSRSDLLLNLSTYANSDGTFKSEDEQKNFSPSAKKLLRRCAKNTFYRLSNDLRELGLLSWAREQKHYGRRTYKIHLQAEKQVPHSQEQVSDSRIEQVPHSQEQVPPRDLITGSMVGPNPSLESLPSADAVAVGALGRFDSIVPAAAGSLTGRRHPLSAETSKSDDDDRRERDNRRRLTAPADEKPDEERERLRIHNLKGKALSMFQERHPGEVEPSLLKLWLDAIVDRAKTRIESANYLVRGLENEFNQHKESPRTGEIAYELWLDATVAKTRIESANCEAIPAQDSVKGNSKYRNAVLFLEDKLAKSGTVSVEEVRHKVLEVIDEKGRFKSWEKCRDFCALLRTDVFPKTPEPREDGERGYFPKTVLELFDLVDYSWHTPELYGFGREFNKVVKYLTSAGKFEVPAERNKFEDHIARRHEQKEADEERKRYHDKVNRRKRERRAERKALSANGSTDASKGGDPHDAKDVERTLVN